MVDSIDESKRLAKRALIIPNLITAIGLISGLFVIFKVNMVEPGEGDYSIVMGAILLLCISGLADFADGFVARWMRAQSRFGLVFDSLSDAITFGIAPVVLVLKSISAQKWTLLSFGATSGGLVFALCGVLRLVRFSVSNQLVKSQKNSNEGRCFLGLPIPAACSALVSLDLLMLSPWTLNYWPQTGIYRTTLLISAMYLLGALMVSRWKFPAIGHFSWKIPLSFGKIAMIALTMVALYYLISLSMALCMVVLTWGYVLLSWFYAFFCYLKGDRDRALGPRFEHPLDL